MTLTSIALASKNTKAFDVECQVCCHENPFIDYPELFTYPEDVRPKAFYTFGDGCFIDVGDGYYSRWSGDFSELKEIQSEEK